MWPFKKKQQQIPVLPAPKPLKTKPIDLTFIHIGKMWDGFAVPTEQVRRILRETNGAFIEVEVYRNTTHFPRLDVEADINCLFNFYEPVAPFKVKINPNAVVGISDIHSAVIRDYSEDE